MGVEFDPPGCDERAKKSHDNQKDYLDEDCGNALDNRFDFERGFGATAHLNSGRDVEHIKSQFESESNEDDASQEDKEPKRGVRTYAEPAWNTWNWL